MNKLDYQIKQGALEAHSVRLFYPKTHRLALYYVAYNKHVVFILALTLEQQIGCLFLTSTTGSVFEEGDITIPELVILTTLSQLTSLLDFSF